MGKKESTDDDAADEDRFPPLEVFFSLFFFRKETNIVGGEELKTEIKRVKILGG